MGHRGALWYSVALQWSRHAHARPVGKETILTLEVAGCLSASGPVIFAPIEGRWKPAIDIFQKIAKVLRQGEKNDAIYR